MKDEFEKCSQFIDKNMIDIELQSNILERAYEEALIIAKTIKSN